MTIMFTMRPLPRNESRIFRNQAPDRAIVRCDSVVGHLEAEGCVPEAWHLFEDEDVGKGFDNDLSCYSGDIGG